MYGQNRADLPERAKTKFEARLKTAAGRNIVSLVRPFDDPVPADVGNLDLITFLFFYHDTTYMVVDRAEMNRKLYAALKPGGVLVIADHSAQPATAPQSARRSIVSKRTCCAAKSKRLASSSSPKEISGAIRRIRVTSRSNRRAEERWTSSCSNSRIESHRAPWLRERL